MFGFGRKTALLCGHKTKVAGELSAHGDTKRIHMPKDKDGNVDYCLHCLSKMTICCAWCGGSIFVGDPITLYTPSTAASMTRLRIQHPEIDFDFDEELGMELPAHAYIYQRDPLQLVGCLRMSCANTGGDRAGFWIPGPAGMGTVYRTRTAYEEVVNNGGSGMLIISDLSNPAEAHALEEHDKTIAIIR